MGVFIRTVILTILLSGVYYLYSVNHNIDKNIINPNLPRKEIQENNINTKDDKISSEPRKREEKIVTLCFLNDKGEFKYVKRKTNDSSLRNSIELLLKGPTKKEKEKGLFSEIPSDTILYWVREDNNKITINLSNNFSEGGGTNSVLARIEQLKNTIKKYRSDYPVYLYLNGKKAEYVGGDGVYIEQPLN